MREDAQIPHNREATLVVLIEDSVPQRQELVSRADGVPDEGSLVRVK